MYEAFYGFKEKPFSMLPDPGFLYLSKKHQAALTLLEYGLLNHVGFCVISGEAGAGKTTILRALLERVADNVTVGLITNTHQSFGGLLDWVLSAFDLHKPNLTHVEMHQIFMEYLIEEYANGHTVLLIVDEAQNMKTDALEELRMLSNVNSEKDQLMQVVLAGQPALKETLRKPDLMQFAQRIAVDYHLEALNVVETCGYIQHRLKKGGALRDVFTPAACERIHCYSGGTPRLINLLCETVLVYGFADQLEMIDVDLVDEMVQERMKDSVVPIVNRDAAKHDNKEAAKALEKDFPWITVEAAAEAEQTEIESAEAGKFEIEQPEVELEASGAEKIKDKAQGEEPLMHVASASNRGKQKELNQESDRSLKDKAKSTNKEVTPAAANSTDGNDTKKQFIKYGVVAVIVGILLIGSAMFLGNTDDNLNVKATDGIQSSDDGKAAKQAMLELQKKREQEEARVRQLQLEAEALYKEREAAAAKAEAEKIALEKVAIEAELAAKKAEIKSQAAEKKRIAAAKERERIAKQQEAKAKADANRLKRERARLDEERRVMKARLEEESR